MCNFKLARLTSRDVHFLAFAFEFRFESLVPMTIAEAATIRCPKAVSDTLATLLALEMETTRGVCCFRFVRAVGNYSMP
jgi:hypothetical protein